MKISYDGQSFLVDGQRRLILSGEVHYFRLPQAEWKGVLEKAKAAGLNSICIIIPWNFHEAQEGRWNFNPLPVDLHTSDACYMCLLKYTLYFDVPHRERHNDISFY